MFQPLKSLFHHEPTALSEADIVLFIQLFLRRELSTDALVCQSAGGGNVVVRVGTATLQQEVLLLEYDLKQALQKETATELKSLKVLVG